MNKINYYFVRHGETSANIDGIVQGWTDSSLDDIGINNSQKLGKDLASVPFHLAYTSDLKRAQETGRIILSYQEEDIPLIPTPAFREFNYGGFENQPTEAVWKQSLPAKVEQLKADKVPSASFVPLIIDELMHDDPVGESEDFMSFWDRIEEAMLFIHDEALEQRIEQMTPEINVLIVGHELPIRFFLHEVLADFDLTQSLEPAHYAHVSYYKGAYHLETWNEI